MTLKYTLSPGDVREGAREDYNYRYKRMLVLAPLLGLGILAYGVYLLSFGGQAIPMVLGGALCLLSFRFLLRRRIYTTRCARAAFRGRPLSIDLRIEAEDNKITSSGGSTESQSDWDAFVDYRVCEKGILIYPQERIFIWIPSRAECEGGTWSDFRELVQEKVQRKL